MTYNRNKVWSSATALWGDAIQKSPKNWRAHFQLAYAYYDGQRCSEAVDQYAKAAALDQSDVRLFVDWALAYDCAGRPADASLSSRLAGNATGVGDEGGFAPDLAHNRA